jgi:hypothetical protein
MSKVVWHMTMSLDGFIAGPRFREAVPVSEVRHPAAPIEPRRKSSNQGRSPPSSPLSPSPTRNDDAPRSWRRVLAA